MGSDEAYNFVFKGKIGLFCIVTVAMHVKQSFVTVNCLSDDVWLVSLSGSIIPLFLQYLKRMSFTLHIVILYLRLNCSFKESSEGWFVTKQMQSYWMVEFDFHDNKGLFTQDYGVLLLSIRGEIVVPVETDLHIWHKMLVSSCLNRSNKNRKYLEETI